MKRRSTQGSEKRTAFSRTFRVLEHLAERASGTGAQDVADALGLNLPTTLRLLSTLVSEGLASRDNSTRRYCVGPALFRLAALTERTGAMEGAIRPALRALVDKTTETACFNLLQPSKLSFSVIAVEEGSRPLRYVVEIGGLHALYAGAGGKAILAFLPETSVAEAVAAREISAATNRKRPELRRLRNELAQVRRGGYALTFGERVPGAVGLAAPVFGADRAVVGSIQITFPEHRYRPREEHRLAEQVMSAARALCITPGSVPPKSSEGRHA